MSLFAALPSDVLNRAKQDGTLAIIRRLDRASKAAFMEALGAYTPKVEPLEVESFYLTRIAVQPSARRSGAGTAAMSFFVDLAGTRPCGLHVKADNLPAISLYRKLGFRFVSDRDFAFRAMLKTW